MRKGLHWCGLPRKGEPQGSKPWSLFVSCRPIAVVANAARTTPHKRWCLRALVVFVILVATLFDHRGVEQRRAHLAHNQEIVGSSPTSATAAFHGGRRAS